MGRRRTIRITRNFDTNPADIRRYLEEQQAPQEFRSLIEALFETVIPNLERFPDLGVFSGEGATVHRRADAPGNPKTTPGEKYAFARDHQRGLSGVICRARR